MFSLIKYEWMKRWKFFLAGLVIFVFVNVDLMIRLLNKSAPTKITAIFIGILFAMGVALFFDHISRLYRSLFTEEGIFYFSLPISGYGLLGARLLAVIVEFITVAAVAFISALVNYKILIQEYTDLNNLVLPDNLYEVGIKGFIFCLLLYVSFLLMVYLSMVLAKSILASIKYGKAISFLCFLGISKIIEKLGVMVEGAYNTTNLHQGLAGTSDWLLTGLIAVILFGVTGYLMDRKINI